jgi:hypothetical protein
MFFFGLLAAFGPVFVWMALPFWVMWLYIAGALLLRAVISYLSRQSILVNTLLLPLQVVSFWMIMIRGGYKYVSGTMTWKGRRIG